MRPNGLGDLQKGERCVYDGRYGALLICSRYCNMDFIVMAALAGLGLLMLTISYDIACQWKVNLAERVKKLPRHMQLPMDDIKLQCALPVWHASSHNGDCKEANSLSFKEGVGKSDGEGVERTWAVLNPAAYATKDAGIGQRADALEDWLDNHNYLKNIGQGTYSKYGRDRTLLTAVGRRCITAQTCCGNRRARQADPGVRERERDHRTHCQDQVEDHDSRLDRRSVPAQPLWLARVSGFPL